MMTYLKNTAGYKMDFFKGMSYADICPIFQAGFDENMRFLFKLREEIEEEDEEIIKSINETPAQKAAKRRKLNEEAQEAEALKKQLEIVHDEDDGVFTEATPLGRKVPVVDYEIVMINKNLDLEDLWKIVKDRFATSKPTNFSDDYLLSTLKTMFKKADGQDAIWKNQQSVYGQALVKNHISSDPAPECQRMALEHDSLSPAIQRQVNVPQADRTVTTSNELDLLFSPMFDELLNGSSKVVSKSFAVCSADAPNQRQQHTTPLNNHTTPAPTCQVPTLAPPSFDTTC
nr:hypothetical protein [Tanacetum cinerariifolium]